METKVWRHFDLVLLATTLILLSYGLAMIYSATLGIDTPGSFESRVVRQILFIFMGIFLFFVMSALDYRVLWNLAYVAYGVIIALLMIVLITGQVTHGSQRWIELGFFQLQPSELGKLTLIMALSRYLADRTDQIEKTSFVLRTFLFPLPMVALVFAQPDVGTGSTYLAIWAGILVIAGLRVRHIASFVLATLAIAPTSWFVMHDYMRERILVFLDPSRDPLGQGYNVIQALISVGAGGLTGRGFTSGTQSQLHFLRVKYADFIFSVLAEELGLVGAAILLGLFLVLLWRGLRVMSIAADPFGRLIATGVVSVLVYQVFVNVGMNSGLLPVTGITLPLISYGGSSTASMLMALGVLESVAMRHRKFEF